MRHIVLFFSLLAAIALNAQKMTVEQHLEDFDLVVKQVEDNYCGFSTKVNAENLSTYVDFKKKEEMQLENILLFLLTIICFLMTTDTIALKSICLKADKYLIIGTL